MRSTIGFQEGEKDGPNLECDFTKLLHISPFAPDATLGFPSNEDTGFFSLGTHFPGNCGISSFDTSINTTSSDYSTDPYIPGDEKMFWELSDTSWGLQFHDDFVLQPTITMHDQPINTELNSNSRSSQLNFFAEFMMPFHNQMLSVANTKRQDANYALLQQHVLYPVLQKMVDRVNTILITGKADIGSKDMLDEEVKQIIQSAVGSGKCIPARHSEDRHISFHENASLDRFVFMGIGIYRVLHSELVGFHANFSFKWGAMLSNLQQRIKTVVEKHNASSQIEIGQIPEAPNDNKLNLLKEKRRYLSSSQSTTTSAYSIPHHYSDLHFLGFQHTPQDMFDEISPLRVAPVRVRGHKRKANITAGNIFRKDVKVILYNLYNLNFF